jgi:GT2 family glycosyltransferase
MRPSLQGLPNKKTFQVSIIIVNYNTGKYLLECLESIEKSTSSFKNPTCEVILVDNASTDGSILEIGKFRSSKNVKILGNNENLGFAKAVNQGIDAADGKYIFLLNPDCRLKENALYKLLEYAEKHTNIGAVGPKLLNSDGTSQTSVIPFPTLQRAIQEFWLNNKVFSKYDPNTSLPIEVEALVMAAFLITPEALTKIGTLNEKYFMYFEDLDYCRELHNAGLKVIYFPDAQVIHHHGVSGKNLAGHENQWRRLIPGSKLYHGEMKHRLITYVIWSGTKLRSILPRKLR